MSVHCINNGCQSRLHVLAASRCPRLSKRQRLRWAPVRSTPSADSDELCPHGRVGFRAPRCACRHPRAQSGSPIRPPAAGGLRSNRSIPRSRGRGPRAPARRKLEASPPRFRTSLARSRPGGWRRTRPGDHRPPGANIPAGPHAPTRPRRTQPLADRCRRHVGVGCRCAPHPRSAAIGAGGDVSPAGRPRGRAGRGRRSLARGVPGRRAPMSGAGGVPGQPGSARGRGRRGAGPPGAHVRDSWCERSEF